MMKNKCEIFDLETEEQRHDEHHSESNNAASARRETNEGVYEEFMQNNIHQARLDKSINVSSEFSKSSSLCSNLSDINDDDDTELFLLENHTDCVTSATSLHDANAQNCDRASTLCRILNPGKDKQNISILNHVLKCRNMTQDAYSECNIEMDTRINGKNIMINKTQQLIHCKDFNLNDDAIISSNICEDQKPISDHFTNAILPISTRQEVKSIIDSESNDEDLTQEYKMSTSSMNPQSQLDASIIEESNLDVQSSNLAIGSNLIVNYLPPFMSQDEVKALFSSIGEVETCKLVREKSSGESLGYAFVKYLRNIDADKAMKALNGLRLQNKTIKVSLARPSSDSIKGANLYICGLPRKMTQAVLKDLFSQCGKIITARILYDNKTGLSRGIAFIRFDQRHEAEQAIDMFNGYQPMNGNSSDNSQIERIIVKFANSPNYIRQETAGHKITMKPSPSQFEFANSLIRQTNPPDGYASTQENLFSLSTKLKDIDSIEHTENSISSRSSDLYPKSIKAATLINPIFAPAIAASTGALTINGWCIFVCNLSPETEEPNLWQLFGPFGAVQTVKLIRDPMTNKCKGFGFVSMCNYEEAILAITSLNGYEHANRILQVSFKTEAISKSSKFEKAPFADKVHGLGDSFYSGCQSGELSHNTFHQFNFMPREDSSCLNFTKMICVSQASVQIMPDADSSYFQENQSIDIRNTSNHFKKPSSRNLI